MVPILQVNHYQRKNFPEEILLKASTDYTVREADSWEVRDVDRPSVLMYFRVLGQVWKQLDQVIPSVEWWSVMKARTDVIETALAVSVMSNLMHTLICVPPRNGAASVI